MEQLIESTIEQLRHEMMESAYLQDSLTDERVVAISQRLDKYIVIYQNIQKKSNPLQKTSA